VEYLFLEMHKCDWKRALKLDLASKLALCSAAIPSNLSFAVTVIHITQL